jgi:putative acetyltransferase
MVTIRPAQRSDSDAIIAVVRAAFSRDGHSPQEEVDVVTETWALGAAPEDLDLVAVEHSTVVGYVVAARGRLSETDVLGVAPLAVTPARQHAGIGTALMTTLIAQAEAHGWPLLLLLGDPAYYQRFGFRPAADLGITYAALGGADPHFQVRQLAGYDAALHGTFTYCWETS